MPGTTETSKVGLEMRLHLEPSSVCFFITFYYSY